MTRRDIPTTYSEALAILGDRDERTIANNTRLVRRGEDVALRLHSTDVVTYLSTGGYRLNTGGWHSVTTKDRINRALAAGWRVYSDKGVWYVYRNGRKVEQFQDGLVVGAPVVLSDVEAFQQAQDEVTTQFEALSRNDSIDQPCEYGHFDCSYINGGPCSNEKIVLRSAALIEAGLIQRA